MKHQAVGIYDLFLKRLLDICLSFVAIILLCPILLIVSALVLVELGSPIIFKQERPGKDGKIFLLYKFRTMLPPRDGEMDPSKDAERLTNFGRILRSTSIDELPELFNILKGDMSIVGPRPLAAVYLPYYTKEERCRHNVRPGLTGLAQVNGRNDLSWEEKFAFDLQYIKHISFIGDVGIILKTIKKVFIREGIGQGEYVPISLHIERANWILTNEGAIKPENE